MRIGAPFTRGLPRPPRRVVAGLMCQAVAALAGVLPLIVVAELGRRAAEAALAGSWPAAGQVWALVAVALGGLLLRVLAGTVAVTLTHLGDADLQLTLRRQLAAHLARLPLSWFGAQHPATVKRAAADDVGALHHVVAHAWPNLVSALVTPVALVGYLVTVDWRLTLAVLLLLGAGGAAHRWALRDAPDRMARYHAATSQLDAAVVELVHGVAAVKIYGHAGQPAGVHHRFRQAAAGYAGFLTDWAQRVAPWSIISQLLYSPIVVLWLVLLVGAGLSAAGWLALPALVPFLITAPSVSAPALGLGYASQEVAAGRAAAGRITDLLATATLPAPAAPPPAWQPPRQVEVSIESVRFSYDGEYDVLRDVSLRLRPGTVTALVGPSGSGKSTLATLVARFSDVATGSVRVGGVDVRDLPADQLYQLVGFVFQQVPQVRMSVVESIRLGRPGAELAQVRAAARAARIDERIIRLPRGYDSVLGEDALLSAGEAQRVSIARALLADPPVLVLDEATAYTDPECEVELQAAISALAPGRTMLVVAHRLASVVDADQIVVLEGGEIVQRGTHAALVAQPERPYARLWAAQQVAAGTEAPS